MILPMKVFIGNQFVDLSKIAVVEYAQGNCKVYFSGKLDSHLSLPISKDEMINLLEKSGKEYQDVENSYLFIRDKICGIEDMGDQAYNFFFEDGSHRIFHLTATVEDMKKMFLTSEEIADMDDEDDDFDDFEEPAVKPTAKGSGQLGMIITMGVVVLSLVVLGTYFLLTRRISF